MSPLVFKKIVEFCIENKKDTGFLGKTNEDIETELIGHLCEDTCVFDYDGEKINGVVTWEITKYIPMEINIVEAVVNKPHILGNLLQDICDRMPPGFQCTAIRNGKFVEYRHPRRVTRLLQKL